MDFLPFGRVLLVSAGSVQPIPLVGSNVNHFGRELLVVDWRPCEAGFKVSSHLKTEECPG